MLAHKELIATFSNLKHYPPDTRFRFHREGGDRRLNVRDFADAVLVQSRLKELGYYKFAVDGAFGKGSRAALRAWSLKEMGLASDGLTLDIQKRLFAGTSL